MKPNSNTIFIILSALVVAGGAYVYLSGQEGTEPPLEVSTEQNLKQVEFQSLLTQLPDDFDTTIFSDPGFMSLRDLKTDIIDESLGRLDPFATISGIGAP